MFKTVTVHVHNPTQEEYDAIPVPEDGTSDGTLKWKSFGDVTVFEPRADRLRTTVDIEYKSYDTDDDFRMKIDRYNDVTV